MTTPTQGNVVPDGADYACDNGKFGKGWPGPEAWWAWLQKTVARYGPDRCIWAVAPDIPFDAAGTLAESTPWLPRIRALGVPVAFAAQNGGEDPGMIPWDDIDVLFLAGDDAWKLGVAAADLVVEAKRRGKTTHMGRVNSFKRISHAASIGCDTSDGTFFAFGPDINHPIAMGWMRDLTRRQSKGVEFPLFAMEKS